MKPQDEPAGMNTNPDLSRLREQLAPLYENPEIDLVILFGSRAAGEMHAESDIDLALRGRGPLDLVAMTNQVTQLLRTDRVDVVDLRRASPVLMMEVVRGGVLLYERSPGLYVASVRWPTGGMSIRPSCATRFSASCARGASHDTVQSGGALAETGSHCRESEGA